MMAYEKDDDLKENLLSEEQNQNFEDDFELISERETLVFEDAIRNRKTKQESFFQEYLLNKIQPGSVKGSMFTMTVAIIGAGVLSLPFAVQQAGLLFGLLLIFLGAITTNFSLRLLLLCAELVQSRSYMDLAHYTGGARLAGLTQFAVCLNLFGTSVGYFVGGAELIQLATKSMMGPDTDRFYVSRDNILILLCLVFVLPLSLFRSLESLRFTSLFSVACITFMTLTIIVKYFEFRILRTVPLVIFAYTCHPNVLPIYLVLKRRSSTRMYKVMNRSLTLATCVYCLCGGFVVLTFGENTKTNFLKNDYHHDTAIICGCIGFSIAMILTVPLFIHTLRDNIKEALGLKPQLKPVQHLILTMLIDFLVVIVALLSGDIASVLSVLGATTNPFICFLLPAFFVCKIGTKNFHVYKTVAVCLAIFFSCFSGMSLVFQLQDGF